MSTDNKMHQESHNELLERFGNEDREEIEGYRQAHEILPLSFFFRSESTSSRLNADFVWFQFYIEILVRMKRTPAAMQDLVEICLSAYEDNNTQQQLIREFQEKYHKTDAIKWYTRDCFLYKQINRVLRQQDICKLFAFRLFIADAYHQLKEKYEEQRLPSSISLPKTTWRAQMMTKVEVDRLRTAKDELISIHSFFSTSPNYEIATGFMHAQEGFISVLFEIELDISLIGNKPFIDTTGLSYMPHEGEILFMLGTIFRIDDVNNDDCPDVYWVKLKLCSDDDTELKPMFDRLKSRINEKTCIYDFAVVLFEMGLLDKAKETCEQLLSAYPSDGMHAVLLHRLLGQVTHEQGQFDEALNQFAQTMRLEEQLLLIHDPQRAKTYINLGLTHKARGKPDEALKCNEQALRIFQNADGEHHEFIATCLANTGILFAFSDPYRALAYFLHALFIHRQHLPTTDTEIALIIGNISSVMGILGNHQWELTLAQQTLAMLVVRLPSMNAQIALAHQNVGAAYGALGRFEEGLVAYHRAATILEKIFQRDHPQRVQIQEAITRMLLKRIHNRLTTRIDIIAINALSERVAALRNVSKDDTNKLKQLLPSSKIEELKDEFVLPPPNPNISTQMSSISHPDSQETVAAAATYLQPSFADQSINGGCLSDTDQPNILPVSETVTSKSTLLRKHFSSQSSCVKEVTAQLDGVNLPRNTLLEEKLATCSLNGYLDITGLNLQDEDVPIIIKRAVRERRCKSISLSKNSLTSAGAKMLVNELIETNNTTLKGLSLKGNFSLGDYQVQEVARLLTNNYPALIELSLSKGALRDEEIILLCRTLQKNATLQYFYAPINVEITDACIDSLIDMLQNNKTLQGLYLPLCSLSNDGKKRLKQAVKDRKRFTLLV